MENLTHTEERYQFNWIVTQDLETANILNSDPKILLQEIFKDDPNSSFLLKKTGFNMSMQVQTWINLYKTAIEQGGNLDEVTDLLISKTAQDVIGFYFEYLTKQDIFPIQIEFKEIENGERVIYASKYNQTLESVTLPSEREGAMTEGIKKAIDILLKSEPETVVFLVSPEGWSGLGHDHPDCQTYVYWINENGDLDALTIRTDLSLELNEKLFQTKLGSKSVNERIKAVVSSPIKINANSFEAVLDLLEGVSGKEFAKQRQEIKNREKLFTLNENSSAIISNLKSYLKNNLSHLNEDSIKIFVTTVGKAILDLMNEVLPEPQKKYKYYRNGYYEYNSADYYSLYQQVQQIAGCNGGGASNSYVDTRLALGLFSGVDGRGMNYVVECPCGMPINAYIASGYQCSSCKGIYLGC